VPKKYEKWARELFNKNIDFLLIELLYEAEGGPFKILKIIRKYSQILCRSS
jgi:hypothetical protein